jgi:hypothetical protein
LSVRLLVVTVIGTTLLAAGMLSYTLLEFEPGAWVALGCVLLLATRSMWGWMLDPHRRRRERI